MKNTINMIFGSLILIGINNSYTKIDLLISINIKNIIIFAILVNTQNLKIPHKLLVSWRVMNCQSDIQVNHVEPNIDERVNETNTILMMRMDFRCRSISR